MEFSNDVEKYEIEVTKMSQNSQLFFYSAEREMLTQTFPFTLFSAGVSLSSCLASGILSILSTWLLILTLIFSILCWYACARDDSNSENCWRWVIVLPVVSAAVIFSLCVIANSIVVFTGIDSCGGKQYAAYVQVGVSYILIVTFAAFFVLFINALRDKD